MDLPIDDNLPAGLYKVNDGIGYIYVAEFSSFCRILLYLRKDRLEPLAGNWNDRTCVRCAPGTSFTLTIKQS